MLKQVEFLGETLIIGGSGALVASKSQAGYWHVVRLNGAERVCDCKGFQNRGQCRHVRAVEELEKEHTSKKAEHNRDTAILAGPVIDPPLFPESKPWSPPKQTRSFEEMFGYTA